MCLFLCKLQKGARLLTYLNLNNVWKYASFPFQQLDINRNLGDRFSTSWSVQRGFVPLPKGFDVQPGDGLGTILPGETLTRHVHFTPAAATLHNVQLVCRTSLNQTYQIKCTGQGVMPHVQFSHSKLALPPTAEGDTSEGDVTLSNPTPHMQAFK